MHDTFVAKLSAENKLSRQSEIIVTGIPLMDSTKKSKCCMYESGGFLQKLGRARKSTHGRSASLIGRVCNYSNPRQTVSTLAEQLRP